MISTVVIALDYSRVSQETFVRLLESSDFSENKLEVWMNEFESSLRVSSHACTFLLSALTSQIEENNTVTSEDIKELFSRSNDDRQEVSDKKYKLSDPKPDTVDHEDFYNFFSNSINLSDLDADCREMSSDRFGLRLGRIFRATS